MKQNRYVRSDSTMKGGFGNVQVCSDTHLDRKVAIKTLQRPSDMARLYDEINALLAIRSKHVVQVYDLLELDGESIGIVEEFIDGECLDVSSYPLSLENYLKTIWQIASGLSDIHAMDIIHRDIKPNNIMIDNENTVKIFDFGLSRPISRATTLGFKGTPNYAAPELFCTETVQFTKAVDVYSFGLTAAFLYSQKFKCPNEAFESMPFVLPENVINILKSCLNANPNMRPEIGTVTEILSQVLLKDRHKALLINKGKPYTLDCSRRGVQISNGSIGKIQIEYDGYRFIVKKVEGEILINNMKLDAQSELPCSCVIASGSSTRPRLEREYITFDMSNPEVMP